MRTRVEKLQEIARKLYNIAFEMDALGLDGLADHVDSINADLEAEIMLAMPAEAQMVQK